MPYPRKARRHDSLYIIYAKRGGMTVYWETRIFYKNPIDKIAKIC